MSRLLPRSIDRNYLVALVLEENTLEHAEAKERVRGLGVMNLPLPLEHVLVAQLRVVG